MHDVIARGLEDYLRGSASRDVEAHLSECERCREEVSRMGEISALFETLHAETAIEPSLGFSQRVMRRVQEEKSRRVWSIFTVEAGFARKLALASLLSLIALGGFLASDPVETPAMGVNTPEAEIRTHDVSSTSPQEHQNGMLVTLATYHE
jgi:anti-sigma factor RsiW